jgi:hypothetical protein
MVSIFLRFILLIALLTPFALQAQEVLHDTRDLRNVNPRVFLGFSTGINNYSGLVGIDVEPVLTDEISVRLTLGGWGFKYGGAVNYFFSQVNQGSSLSLGLSFANGIDHFNPELETVDFGNIPVPMRFDRVGTLNFLYNYNIRIGRKGKFVLGGGYAVPLNSDPYTIKNSVQLTSTSETIMNWMVPGGLMLELRLAFGI